MPTISKEYAELNKELHARRPDYGCKSSRHGPRVLEMIDRSHAQSVLDYGCGKGDLVRYLERMTDCIVVGYDPGHPDYCQEVHLSCDIVVCTDVMEHIEPEMLNDVLTDISSKCKKAAFFHVATRLDRVKLLADGTNPHKIVQSKEWWIDKISAYFEGYKCQILLDVPGKAFNCMFCKLI